MRHFPRLNRVACGILRRQHPSVVTLSEQNDRVGQCARRSSDDIPAAMRRWSPIAPVSTIVGSVSVNVRRRPASSQIIYVEVDHLLRVGLFVIACRTIRDRRRFGAKRKCGARAGLLLQVPL